MGIYIYIYIHIIIKKYITLCARLLCGWVPISTASPYFGDPHPFTWANAEGKKRAPLKYWRLDQYFMNLYIKQGGMLPTRFLIQVKTHAQNART